MRLLLQRDSFRGNQKVTQGTSHCPGIHCQSPAERSRNTAERGSPAESMFRGKTDHIRQGTCGTGANQTAGQEFQPAEFRYDRKFQKNKIGNRDIRTDNVRPLPQGKDSFF